MAIRINTTKAIVFNLCFVVLYGVELVDKNAIYSEKLDKNFLSVRRSTSLRSSAVRPHLICRSKIKEAIGPMLKFRIVPIEFKTKNVFEG